MTRATPPPSPPLEPGVRRRFGSGCLMAAFIFLALLLVVFVLLYDSGPESELAGEINIRAPGTTQVFLGGRLLGVGGGSISWKELFAGAGKGWFLELAPTSPGATAEQIAGPGANLLTRVSVSSFSTFLVQATQEEIWLRRGDGTLDQVVVLSVSIEQPGKEVRRLVLPIRARQPGGQGGYCGIMGGGIFSHTPPFFLRIFGASRRVGLSFSFTSTPGNPPPEFAEELKKKPLWQP